MVSTGQGIIGFNMFAYCMNNPVNYVDFSGYRASKPLMTIIGENGGKEYIDPQQPPPPESGYIPPKKNKTQGKVKNPNGAGRGWPAKDGGVWVPNNLQDGGPGWEVQYPDGSHKHKYPDGHERTHNIVNDIIDLAKPLFWGTVRLGVGAAIVVLMADDATGVGVLNDALIPVLVGFLIYGEQKDD